MQAGMGDDETMFLSSYQVHRKLYSAVSVANVKQSVQNYSRLKRMMSEELHDEVAFYLMYSRRIVCLGFYIMHIILLKQYLSQRYMCMCVVFILQGRHVARVGWRAFCRGEGERYSVTAWPEGNGIVGVQAVALAGACSRHATCRCGSAASRVAAGTYFRPARLVPILSRRFPSTPALGTAGGRRLPAGAQLHPTWTQGIKLPSAHILFFSLVTMISGSFQTQKLDLKLFWSWAGVWAAIGWTFAGTFLIWVVFCFKSHRSFVYRVDFMVMHTTTRLQKQN